MGVLNEQSLALTVDAVSEAAFYARRLSVAERREAGRFIASRQGLAGAYGGFLFAPVESYRHAKLVMFTGEARLSGGGADHVLGQEAWRALKVLAVEEACVREAMSRAEAAMHERLYPGGKPAGAYCCATCSCAVLRNMAASVDPSAEAWAAAAVKHIRAARDAAGRWQRYPFYYTLLALWELPDELSGGELGYVAPTCERLLRRPRGQGSHGERRRVLLERTLARV